MVLVDTDVLIDCLRGVDAAKKWLEATPTETLGIPGIAAMELLIGCRNQADLHQVQKFLRTCDVIWPDASEFAQAYELLAAFRLTSGIGIPDCVIAAMSLARKARLHTFNVKHFTVIPGIDVQQPYARP